MKRRTASAAFAVATLLIASSVRGVATAPGFAGRPRVTKEGAVVRIRFAVTAPTDVEVAVLDAENRVVRHLAAGWLGGTNPPPEPLKAGLDQELAWDGKNDEGQPCSGGPFQIRLRVGMKPELDGFLLENPASTGPISALAVGPNGNLYVFHRDPVDAHWGSTKIKILSRDGKHIRAVMPPPADATPEKIKPLRAFWTDKGDLVPRIHDLLRLNFWPFGLFRGIFHWSV